MKQMHEIQKAILEIGSQENLRDLTLREIGKKVERITGEKADYRQKIKHHIDQLIKKGLLQLDSKNNKLQTRPVGVSRETSGLVSIPIVGSANCGPATQIAQEDIEGYLRVSSKLVKPQKTLFAIRAIGDSMNEANTEGGSINDGDFVIVDGNDTDAKNGDYVLSVIDGLANIKRLKRNDEDKTIALISESTNQYPPIYIHEEDIESNEYLINGKVIRVIKNVN